jgi:hypothetical protein
MPKKTSIKRSANYAYRLNPERIKVDLEFKRQDMINRQTSATEELFKVEERTRSVLASETTVYSIDLPNYFAAAKELWAKQNKLEGGAQLDNEAAVVIAKWAMRGLEERILVRIRDEVFSINEPAKKK